MTVTVREVQAQDQAAWGELFAAYRAFYRKPEDPAAVSTVWTWLLDPRHEVRGLVAVADDEVVGIAHYRGFARPSSGDTGVWLDDLFTARAARGRGVARTLIAEVSRIAAAEGASLVRWITSADNTVARGLYDRVATATDWVVYDRAPGAAG